MYKNFSEMLKYCKENKSSIWEVSLINEINLSGKSEEEIFKELIRRLEIMKESAKNALDKPVGGEMNLIRGVAKNQFEHSKKQTICGKYLNTVMAYALSCSEVNSAMGKICAAPTAGSCGILPAVIISVGENLNLSEKEMSKGLLTSAAVGAVIMKNGTVAGAEGGCQAECGVAAAMASAAAVEIYGGDAEMALEAASISLINVMGLVCDPIAGLVQVPCAQRNASQSLNAMLSADMALSGMKIGIPLDEVVEAMVKVGKMLPWELKETAAGGIAATKAGKAIAEKFFG